MASSPRHSRRRGQALIERQGPATAGATAAEWKVNPTPVTARLPWRAEAGYGKGRAR